MSFIDAKYKKGEIIATFSFKNWKAFFFTLLMNEGIIGLRRRKYGLEIIGAGQGKKKSL